MKLNRLSKFILTVLLVVLVLAGISVPTYLYLNEKENTRKQALSTSFQSTFGNKVTILGYEEVRTIPIIIFQTKGDDGKEYTVLAGEFGSAWVVLNKWETTPTVAPAATPTPKP